MEREPIDLTMLVKLLDYVSPNVARDDWVRVLMAIKSEFGDSARDVAMTWSMDADNYDSKDFAATWKSIRSGGGVKVGSLIALAKQNGFRFEPIEPTQAERMKAEMKAREQVRAQQTKLEEEAKQQGYLIAQEKTQTLLAQAKKAQHGHAYLVKKGLGGAVLPSILQVGGNLVIPVCHFEGERIRRPIPYQSPIYSQDWQAWSAQFINANGGKWFMKGGRVQGGFFPLRFDYQVNSFVICEGMATGLTIASFYDYASNVICAFNAGNLARVAQAFKSNFPMAAFTIAADNDRETALKTGVNVGIEKATKAARLVDGIVSYPDFADDESGTDWNDRFLLDYPLGFVDKTQSGANIHLHRGGRYA
ncbi:MAG: PriCT-2 domain-containing protein [Thiomicrospira sp.]